VKIEVGTFFRVALAVMDMTEFTVSGRWQSRDGWETFEKTLEAPNEDVAREHTFAEFGSKHGLKRTQVEIEEVGA